MLYATTPRFTSVTSQTALVCRRVVRSASFLYYKRAHAAFILVLILGAAAVVVPPNHSGSGSIQATARVVDGRWDRAAAELGTPILPEGFTLDGASAAELQEWVSEFEGEIIIDGATVDVEFIPASAEDPAIIQVAWTSN